MLTIEYNDPRTARKLKWKLKGTKTEIEALKEMFGDPSPVKARNPWGPKGMPLDVRRQRALDDLALIEAEYQKTA